MGGVFSRKISRKEFLKYAGLGLLGVVIAKPLTALFQKPEKKVAGAYGNGPYGGVQK